MISAALHRRRFGAVALCALTLLLATAGVASAQAPSKPELAGAHAAIVIDARDGATILAKGSESRLPIASTTKLMTALLTLERTRPAQEMRAANYRAGVAESKLGLIPGERMRVADLFEALLLDSANDAAETLAEGISGSREAFVAAMNRRARRLGLRDTHYANPIGLDAPDNYSSAHDLARLARHLLRNPRFARVVNTPRATLASGARPRTVINRNLLVDQYPFVDGVKTGHTNTAGYILVGAARNKLGAQVVSVVLGEPSEAARDEDSLALLRYGLGRFRRVEALTRGHALATASIAYSDGGVRLVAKRGVSLVTRRGESIRTRVDAPAELEGQIDPGTRVGHVSILRGGKVVAKVSLVTAREVPRPGALTLIAAELPRILVALAAIGALLGLADLGRRARGRRLEQRRDAEREQRRRERDRARAQV